MISDPILLASASAGAPDGSFSHRRYRLACGAHEDQRQTLRRLERPDPEFGFVAVERIRLHVDRWRPSADYVAWAIDDDDPQEIDDAIAIFADIEE